MRYLMAMLSLWMVTPASAQSCVEMFEGAWAGTASTGQTYVGHHLANGDVTADCAGCGAVGKWHCSGNTITKDVNGIHIVGTLSANGTIITEKWGNGGAKLVRMGAVPRQHLQTTIVCSPRAQVVGQGAVEQLAVTNDCNYGVSFSIRVETYGVGTRKLWSICAPAHSENFAGWQTSSVNDQKLTATATHRRCN